MGMKFKKYGTKMIVMLLPAVLIGTIIITYISCTSAETAIMEQVNATMDAELASKLTDIEKKIDSVGLLAASISKMVGTSYTYTELADYETMLSQIIYEEDIVLGSGLWFEPYVYDKDQKYVGPYYFKDGDSAVCTMDYSNAEYDYFNQEYYTNTVGSPKVPAYTEAYYDETSDTVMSSCSYPIYNEKETYLGCVTVDIELTSVQELVNSIQIGEGGKAFLINSEGVYLSTEDSGKIMKISIADEENESLAKAGKSIIAEESGSISYFEEKEAYNIYFEKLPVLGWTLAIKIPAVQLNQPVNNLMQILVIISAVIIAVLILVILILVRNITKNLKNVNRFAMELADGNFLIKPLPVKGRDEFSCMGEALNKMYAENKAVISAIADQFQILESDSSRLHSTTEQMQNFFVNIHEAIHIINEDMMASSAATQELTASSQSVMDSVDSLADQTKNSNKMTIEIRNRAIEIEKNSSESFANAEHMVLDYQENLGRSIEKAKVVESIGTMAETISKVAEQINLLSLNASIEAARAGEQGRGFAVVASEIGQLAKQTKTTVEEIRITIQEIHLAFGSLTKDAQSLLTFISNTVTPDYSMFASVAKQYGKDAEGFEKIVENIAGMAENMQSLMEEINSAIGNVAEAMQNSADRSGSITDSARELTDVVKDVAGMAEDQNKMSLYMDTVVKKFKLKE